MVIVTLLFLVSGILMTLGGIAIFGFDLYLMTDSGLKLLTNYDMLFMMIGNDGVRNLQSDIQNMFGIEFWGDYVQPFLTNVPASVTFGLPGILFFLVGFKSLPKNIKNDPNAPKSTTEALHRAQVRAGDRRS